MVKFYCPLKKKRYKKEQIEKMCKDCPKCGSCNTGLAVTKGKCGEGSDTLIYPYHHPFMSVGGENDEKHARESDYYGVIQSARAHLW